LERLDPSLSDRPSRFDRKYKFDNPGLSERIMYCKHWQRKLRSSKFINYPKSLIEKIAALTADFSFAYIKEAFVSTLMIIAGDLAKGCAFEEILESQITSLREQLGNAHAEKTARPSSAPVHESNYKKSDELPC